MCLDKSWALKAQREGKEGGSLTQASWQLGGHKRS